jgi:hypothetical protein
LAIGLAIESIMITERIALIMLVEMQIQLEHDPHRSHQVSELTTIKI